MTPILVGQKLGHFLILEQIGAGGMGVVYRAQDEHLGRDVAIKVLNATIFSDEHSRRQFRKEAIALSKLNHPNIETVYDFTNQDGVDFLALEYIPGITLSEKLVRGPLREKEIQDLSIQLLDGLSAAHQKQILHRDLKPNNVRITPDGRLKILDFGLAKFGSATVETATTESLPAGKNPVGTLPYMAPEVLRGDDSGVSGDIYASGTIIYEMATGRRPFPQTQTTLLIDAILHEDPPPPASINPKISAGLEALILKTLDKSPERRYSSAREIQVDLQRLTLPIGSVAYSRPQALPKNERLKTVIALAILMALSLLFAFRQPLLKYFAPTFLPEQKYLAILPFRNVGSTAANQAFCDGLAETLASRFTELEQFHGTLWVVPTSEIRTHEIASVAEARKDFAVTLAITGSVQREHDNMRLTVNLVDAKTLRQLQAITIDSSILDPSLQDDLISQIAEMMQLELDPKAKDVIGAEKTTIGRAYDYYVQGEGYLVRSEKAENIDAAITQFEQARSLDPNFALAYAGLARAYWQKYDLTNQQKWIDMARRYGKRGLQLNNRLAPVHVILGVIENGTGKYEEAIGEFNQALKVDPANFEAYLGLAKSYELMQDFGKAEGTYKKAIALRPNVWSGYNWLGTFYYSSARLPEAAKMFEKVVELVPDSFRGYSNLGGIYLVEGRYPDAISIFEKSIAIRPTPDAYSNLGYTYYLVRRFPDAAATYEKATKLNQREYYSIWGGLGDSYSRLPNQNQKAQDAYQHAIQLANDQLALNPRDADALLSLAYFYAKLGNKSESLSKLNYALSLEPDSPEFAFFAALVYNQFGQTKIALDWLERAVKRNYPTTEIKNRIEFDNLHDDSAFRALLSESKRP